MYTKALSSYPHEDTTHTHVLSHLDPDNQDEDGHDTEIDEELIENAADWFDDEADDDLAAGSSYLANEVSLYGFAAVSVW